ncbi:MAG: hypothetical protein JO112_24005 [Planctomycetes bacterium]|nr:hypothetical protein [Planctomycetota bacterium]
MAKAPTKSRLAPTPKPIHLEDQDSQPNGNRHRPTPPPATGAKNRQATAIKENEVLTAVGDLNLDGVSGNIASTQVEVQKSLAGLSAKLVEQLQVLRNVEKAIDLKRDDLKQLYDIEAAAIELDDLKAQIESQRDAWQEEQARKQREFAEMQSERNKQWVRTEEEYQYRLSQEHKKGEDTFAAKIADLEKANKNKQEMLEKSWAEREGELKKRETELADLKAKVEAFPEQVKKEVNAAVAVATNSVKKEYETKNTLAAKDLETFQKLAAQETASLKQALEKMTAEVSSLKIQLDQARADVKEISSKALESASGRDALAQLSKLMEKEQSSKPGK